MPESSIEAAVSGPQSHGTDVRNMSGRATRAALAALAALPALDLIAIVFGTRAATDRVESVLTLAFEVIAAICLWVALYWLGSVIVRWRNGLAIRSTRFVVAVLLYVGLALLMLYQVLLWAYVALNGSLPSAQTLAFVRDNMTRVSLHLIQTSPVMALGLASISALAAFAIVRLLSIASHTSTTEYRRQLLQALVLFIGWYFTSSFGTHRMPSDALLERSAQGSAEEKSTQELQNLPPRAEVATPMQSSVEPLSVVVILVESLRHDLLETNPEAVPFIRSMYAEHTGFEYAYATASHSNLTDLAFWYAQYPLRTPSKETYPADADWRGVSLFDLFKQGGYTTAYISSQNEKWGEMINWLKTPTVDYFFDSESFHGDTWENYDDEAGLGALIKRGIAQAGKIEDSQTLEVAKHWIDSLDGRQPFFLGMNLQNTHFSYVVTPGAEQPYQPSDLGFRAVYYRWPESEKERVRNRYLNSVHNVDGLLKGFADYLKSKGLWDNVLFVVLGDNGEGFYEHGFGNHSGPMYDEAVRTLAFIKMPAGSGHKEGLFERPISHIDVAATIPDIVGLNRPWSFQGRSIFSTDCTDRPVYMYSNALVRQFGVVSWPYKYLFTAAPSESIELFDLAKDPQERTNLASESSTAMKQLDGALSHWVTLQLRYYGDSYYLHKAAPDYCAAP
jgi:arylsulfatase A-like enzyme